MPLYRIHRLKEGPRQQFRLASHTIGEIAVKPKDYEPADSVEAGNAYALWKELEGSERALLLGDILETEDGRLCIYKYVGFEAAMWRLQEEKAAAGVPPPPTAEAAATPCME